MKTKKEKGMWAFALVLGIAILTVVPISAAAQFGECPMEGMPGHSENCKNGFNWSKPETENTWREYFMKTRYMGCMNYTDGHFTGRFVDFYLDEHTGKITNYKLKIPKDGSMETLGVFDAISVSNFSRVGLRVMGNIVMLRGENAMIIVHDNPSGVIHHIAFNTTLSVTYTLNQNFYAMNTYKNHTYANIAWIFSASGNISGTIVAGNQIKITNQTLSTTLVNGETSTFRMHAWHRYGVPIADENMIKVGAELALAYTNGLVMDDGVAYRADVLAEVREMTQNRIHLRVSGEGSGTVIALMVEKENMEMKMERIQVKMDGKEIKRGSVEEMFGTGNGEAKYAVTTDDAGNYVIFLYVPHFSEHEFEIFATSGEINILYMALAFGGGFVVGIVLAYLVFRSRKAKSQ
ncbi:MAG: hypothetical protein ACPL1Y_04505 [Thermoplasmata archaeon]